MGNHKVLKTSGTRSIRYSMYDFIEAVKRHSIVWNRDHQHFHHREKRETAWPSIARQLCPQFDDATTVEKRKIAETLAKRWKNTRDSYFRAQRERDLDDERHRSYIYEKELAFLSRDDTNGDDDLLQDVVEKPSRDKESVKKLRTSKRTSNAATKVAAKKRHSSVTSNFSLSSEIDEVCQEIEEQLHENTNDGEATSESQTIKDEKRNQLQDAMVKSKKVEIPPKSYNTSMDETSNSMRDGNAANSNSNSNVVASTASMTTASTSNEPDPDQAFFDSIKPVVRNMSVDQKLDFQIEILKLLKNFRSK